MFVTTQLRTIPENDGAHILDVGDVPVVSSCFHVLVPFWHLVWSVHASFRTFVVQLSDSTSAPPPMQKLWVIASMSCPRYRLAAPLIPFNAQQ